MPFPLLRESEAGLVLRGFFVCFLAGARTRASIAVSLFDHSNPFKRTQTQLSTGSTPTAYTPSSSSSLLGPLNLHMYLDQTLLPGVLAPRRPFDVGTCIEEDELEHETSSQPSLSTYGPALLQHLGYVGSFLHLVLCCVVRPDSLESQQSVSYPDQGMRALPFHASSVSASVGGVSSNAGVKKYLLSCSHTIPVAGLVLC